MPLGGALKLKGGASLRVRKKAKKAKKKRRRDDAVVKPEAEEIADSAAADLLPLVGVGHLTSSGTAVAGHGTSFSSELSIGDTLLITHPTTLVEESRQVRMLLSDISLGIDSPFSSNLVSTTRYRYVKLPREEDESEEARAAKRRKNARAEEGSAVGTYASGDTGDRVTIRVKKAGAYGGYHIIHETASRELSRTELMELRAKRKGDRHCM